MKNLITIAAALCGLNLIAAPQAFNLTNGQNSIPAAGEIVGVECMTIGETQSVTATVVTAVTEVTNAYKTVIVPHTRYDIVLTNWNGSASVVTNVYDSFNYADWSTNLVSVTPAKTNLAEQVADGTRVKATYEKRLAIGSGAATGHYLLITPASTLNFFGGRIDVDCGAGDNIRVLVK